MMVSNVHDRVMKAVDRVLAGTGPPTTAAKPSHWQVLVEGGVESEFSTLREAEARMRALVKEGEGRASSVGVARFWTVR